MMKKRGLNWLLLGLMLLAGTTGCLEAMTNVRGSGTVAEETRDVSGFDSVRLATIGNLVIEMGDQESLRIEAEDNLLEHFRTEVSGGELRIGTDLGTNVIPTKVVNFYLTVTELESVTLSGVGNIEVPNTEVVHFSVTISGAGAVNVDDLEATSLEVQISGLGSLTIEEGEVDDQEIHISGGGSYSAKDLDSAQAEVSVEGLGSASIRVRDSLTVNISGGGSVEYIGDPTVDQSVSGVGHVEQIEE
jgi:hypothetical protein